MTQSTTLNSNHLIKIKLIMPTQYCNVVFLQNCIIVVFVENNEGFGEKLTCNPKVKIVSVKWEGTMKSQPIFNTSLEWFRGWVTRR